MSKRYRTAFINTMKMICSCACFTKSHQHSFKASNFYYKNSAATSAASNMHHVSFAGTSSAAANRKHSNLIK
jgi:hypothetical protein